MYEKDYLQIERNQLYMGLCQIAEQLDLGVVIIDPKQDYIMIHTNPVFIEMTEYSKEEIVGATLALFNGKLINVEQEQEIFTALVNEESITKTLFHYRRDGSAFWHELKSTPIFNAIGEIEFHYITTRDISDYMNMKSLFQLEREVYANIEHSKELSVIFDHICRHVVLTFQKKCHCAIFLLENAQLKVAAYGDLKPDFKEAFHNMDLSEFMANKKSSEFLRGPLIVEDLKFHHNWRNYQDLIENNNLVSSWSQPIKNSESQVVGIFSLYFEERTIPREEDFQFLDRIAPIVTVAMKYYAQKTEIRQLAYFDTRTGLRNIESFKRVIAANEQYAMGKLYMIRPGEYQNIVDLYGLQGVDELLFQLAKRIKELPPFREALFARYTDSTIIIAYNEQSIKEPSENLLEQLLQEPFSISGNFVYVTLKIGNAWCDSTDIELSIQHADTALSTALKFVGTVVRQYEESQLVAIQEEMKVLSYISEGIKNEEFTAVLQPKVSIETGEIESFEALARWTSKEIGFVSPAAFIPVAESTGNIHHVDKIIFRKILHWLKGRQDAGKELYQVAVNISPGHFYHPAFVENMVELIEQYGIDTKYLKFEITESVELENILRAKKIMTDLKSYGIATAIDDFGVGYSSLSYLQELPFNEIKIDKSFIDNLADARMNAVVKTIIQLSSALQMNSVAEGIETVEQYEELKVLGCNTGQGYYFYLPMPLHKIDELLDSQTIATI